jgi:hypothetical protein
MPILAQSSEDRFWSRGLAAVCHMGELVNTLLVRGVVGYAASSLAVVDDEFLNDGQVADLRLLAIEVRSLADRSRQDCATRSTGSPYVNALGDGAWCVQQTQPMAGVRSSR